MKILVISPYYYPRIGGTENYVRKLCILLKKVSKDTPIIITTDDKIKNVKIDFVDNIKVYRLPVQFIVSNTPVNLKWFKYIEEIIKKEKPDIINAHTPVPFFSDIASFASGNIPFVLTYHAATLYKQNNIIANIILFFYSFFEQITLRRSNAIIAVSSYVKQNLPSRFQKRTFVVNNSISKEEIINKTSKKENYFLFIATLDKTHAWKGLDHVIDAIAIYKNKYDKNVLLNVMGDGNYKKHYEDKVKDLGLQKNIVFLGRRVGSQKNTILQKATALILYPTSSNDAFPTVILEAWSKHVPVIASKIGAIPYLIENNRDGLLVKAHDPEELANGLYKLWKSPALQNKIITNSLESLKQDSLWETNVKIIHDIFSKQI